MAPHMLHPVHVPHDGLGQVRQVPLAKVAQGQFPQPLRQTQAGGLDLAVHQAIGGPVLLQVGHKGQQDEPHRQGNRQHRPRQRRPIRQGLHKGSHQQVQDTHAAHDHQVGDDGPERAAFGVFQALVGQGVFALKRFAEHFPSPLSYRSLVIFHWTARL